jgi:hypothetical protein
MGDIVGRRAGDPVEAVWWRGRRRTTFTQSVGGGFRANVVDGVLVGFGLEPVAGPDVSPFGPRHHVALLWAAPIAGAAAAAGAVATGLVWRHRRAA